VVWVALCLDLKIDGPDAGVVARLLRGPVVVCVAHGGHSLTPPSCSPWMARERGRSSDILSPSRRERCGPRPRPWRDGETGGAWWMNDREQGTSPPRGRPTLSARRFPAKAFAGQARKAPGAAQAGWSAGGAGQQPSGETRAGEAAPGGSTRAVISVAP